VYNIADEGWSHEIAVKTQRGNANANGATHGDVTNGVFLETKSMDFAHF
jgi:hypothetical protein